MKSEAPPRPRGRRRLRAAVTVVAVLALAAAGLALLVATEPAPGPVGGWMAVDGVAPRFQTVRGLRLRYVRKGSGPPVVLLHGLASSIYTWKDVLPALAAEHDVIAVDLPGFGGSDVPAEPGGDVLVGSVLGLLDEVGVPRASFVGNSLGGAVAVAIAVRHPEGVFRLVLIDAAGYNYAPRDRPFLLRLAAAAPAWTTAALPRRALFTAGLRQVFADDALVTPEKIDEYVVPMGRPGALGAVHRLLTRGEMPGFPGVIRDVRAPTLVLWGARDEWIDVRDASRFARDIPGARLVVLPDSGHMPQEERPAETAELIGGFLR